jgi:hypothetical protein
MPKVGLLWLMKTDFWAIFFGSRATGYQGPIDMVLLPPTLAPFTPQSSFGRHMYTVKVDGYPTCFVDLVVSPIFLFNPC